MVASPGAIVILLFCSFNLLVLTVVCVAAVAPRGIFQTLPRIRFSLISLFTGMMAGAAVLWLNLRPLGENVHADRGWPLICHYFFAADDFGTESSRLHYGALAVDFFVGLLIIAWSILLIEIARAWKSQKLSVPAGPNSQ